MSDRPNKADQAIDAIKRILLDDNNYQSSELKLGGIWAVCTRTAEFEQRQDVHGLKFVEVKMLDALRQIAETTKGYPNASREGEIARKVLSDAHREVLKITGIEERAVEPPIIDAKQTNLWIHRPTRMYDRSLLGVFAGIEMFHDRALPPDVVEIRDRFNGTLMCKIVNVGKP